MSKKVMVFFLVAFLFGLCSAGATFAITLAVNISNPSSGSEYPEGTTIFLQGSGIVTESNFKLENNDLRWYANDAYIGKGSFVSWTPIGGSYRVALIGEREGATAVDEIFITVISAGALTVSVTIENPAAGTEFLQGETVYLQGRGTVQETGAALSESQLKWMANNVQIGVGDFVAWTPSPGVYRVTLIGQVEESKGLDEIDVKVTSLQDLTVTVSITSPAAGATFQLGETVIFIGSGEVTETTEPLPQSDLVWMSNLDGPIGVGSYITTDNLTAGTHTIYLIGRQKAIDSVQITVSSSSFYFPQPVQSGDVAAYNWATNTLYIPLLVGDVAYWVNLAVTSFTSPLTFELTGIGAATFSPTASYADFNLFTNTVWVPVFVNQGASYYLSLKLTNSEAPFTFELTGSGLNP
jgi:hypothetical protein